MTAQVTVYISKNRKAFYLRWNDDTAEEKLMVSKETHNALFDTDMTIRDDMTWNLHVIGLVRDCVSQGITVDLEYV